MSQVCSVIRQNILQLCITLSRPGCCAVHAWRTVCNHAHARSHQPWSIPHRTALWQSGRVSLTVRLTSPTRRDWFRADLPFMEGVWRDLVQRPNGYPDHLSHQILCSVTTTDLAAHFRFSPLQAKASSEAALLCDAAHSSRFNSPSWFVSATLNSWVGSPSEPLVHG